MIFRCLLIVKRYVFINIQFKLGKPSLLTNFMVSALFCERNREEGACRLDSNSCLFAQSLEVHLKGREQKGGSRRYGSSGWRLDNSSISSKVLLQICRGKFAD